MAGLRSLLFNEGEENAALNDAVSYASRLKGTPSLSAYDPSYRDRAAASLMGDRPSEARMRLVDGLLGSRGAGTTGISLSDLTPLSILFGANESSRDMENDSPLSALLNAMAVIPVVGAAPRAARTAMDVSKRQLNKAGLYSKALEAAQDLKQNKGTPEQMRAMLLKSGVKPDELKWTGFDDWAKGKKSITKDDTVAFLDQNRVQLAETQLGGKQAFDEKRLSQLEKEYASLKQHPIDDPSFGEEKYDELIRLLNVRDQSSTTSLYASADRMMKEGQRAQARGDKAAADRYFKEYEFINTRAEKLDLEGAGLEKPTKFDQFTIPGGDNYREVAVTLPERPPVSRTRYDELNAKWEREQLTPAEMAEHQSFERWTNNSDRNQASVYKVPQGHRMGDDADINRLLHLRMKDRVDPDGRKVLHLEEMQSDWAQEGRKKGFAEAATRTMQGRVEPDDSGAFRVMWEDGSFSGGYSRESAEARAAQGKTNEKAGLPPAPFVDGTQKWTDLGLKRALKEAADGNYDALAWTPGAEQAKRYDLSKQVSEIHYYPEIGSLDIHPKDGSGVITRAVKPEEIENYVGKDVAKRLVSGDVSEIGPAGEVGYRLVGDDLSIGGEGMIGYYDKIVPTQLQKLAKGLDPEAKFGTLDFPINTQNKQISRLTDDELAWELNPAHSNPAKTPQSMSIPTLNITPAMREKIKQGLPLFTMAPAAFALPELLGLNSERPEDDNAMLRMLFGR